MYPFKSIKLLHHLPTYIYFCINIGIHNNILPNGYICNSRRMYCIHQNCNVFQSDWVFINKTNRGDWSIGDKTEMRWDANGICFEKKGSAIDMALESIALRCRLYMYVHVWADCFAMHCSLNRVLNAPGHLSIVHCCDASLSIHCITHKGHAVAGDDWLAAGYCVA